MVIEGISSVLVAADRLVRGVFVALPFTDPVWLVVPVVVDVESCTPLLFAACLAAFSANRFCFDADGGIIIDVKEGKNWLRWTSLVSPAQSLIFAVLAGVFALIQVGASLVLHRSQISADKD